MKLKRIYSGWTVQNQHHDIHEYSVFFVDGEIMHHKDIYVMGRSTYKTYGSDRGSFWGSYLSSDQLLTGHTKTTHEINGSPSFLTHLNGLRSGVSYSLNNP